MITPLVRTCRRAPNVHTYLTLTIVACALLWPVGCSSTPDASPHSPVEDRVEIGLERQTAVGFDEPELPEPFIRVVDLGRLRVGMTKAEVLELFPDPQEVRTTRAETEFWAYRFAELQFRNGRLENWFNIR